MLLFSIMILFEKAMKQGITGNIPDDIFVR